MNIPPENILRCMRAEDRKQYGPAGLTKDEAERVYTDGEEKELQKHCIQLLSQRGVRMVINPPMHRRSQLPAGWPDLTFCWNGRACAVECKTIHGTLRKEQYECIQALIDEGWRHDVVHSLKEFQKFLDDAI